MAEFEHKRNSGSLFKNKKNKDAQPDYKGTMNFFGKKLDIAIWVKDGRDGPWYSFNFTEKEAPQANNNLEDVFN